MATSLAIINSQPPFSESLAKESLDMALIFGSYEQDIALFFQGDGVWQLIDKQNGALLGVKDFLKTFSAFPLYDIEKVYICEKSLLERGLDNMTLNIQDYQVLNSKAFSDALAQFPHVLRF